MVYGPVLVKATLLFRMKWQALAHSFVQCLPAKIIQSLFESSRSLKDSQYFEIEIKRSERMSFVVKSKGRRPPTHRIAF